MTLWGPEDDFGSVDPAFAAHTFSVGELTGALREALGVLFPDEVWVEGEIASLSTGRTRDGNGSRHVYFDLAEPTAPTEIHGMGTPPRAVLPVVLFDTNRRKVNDILKHHRAMKMTDGVRVRIRGRLDLYPPQARLQLRMSSIDPLFTIGVLQSDRERVLAMMEAEGLLGRNATLAIPAVPRRVGVATSAGSAAEADFLHELRTSGLAWEVVMVDTPMQGADAPTRVQAALVALEARGCDVIAVVRGGGARTDLAAFDHETIARTIARLGTPVFTGIGHEVDTSVADAVAAVACKTPTACAADIVSRAAAWTTRATVAADVMPAVTRRALERARSRDAMLSARLASAAGSGLTLAASRLAHGEERLGAAPRRVIASAVHQLDAANAMVRALDPQRTLERGYSITRTTGGAVVRTAHDAPPGTTVVTTTAEGEITSVVARVSPGTGASPADPPVPTEPADEAR